MATKKKKAVVKKPRIPSISKQIAATILELCANSNNELMICELNESYSYALLLKKISVTTFYVQNADGFCPMDRYQGKEFFTAFYVIWANFDIGIEDKCDLRIPAFEVRTPQEAEKDILSYDGEAMQE